MFRTVVTLLFALVMAAGAQAQPWPARPITFVVPVPAGGPTDVVARLVAQRLRDNAGWNIVVENISGGGATIGAGKVAAAPPDGYTFLIGATGPNVVNVHIMKKLPYKPSDFAPVTGLVRMPNAMIVGAELPVKNVADLIALAKQKPDTVSFGSTGIGQSTHLSGEIFKQAAGIDMLHVPYRGSAQALPELIAGRITLMFDPLSSALPQAQAGKVRILGVTSAERSPNAPDIPTIAEQGLAGFDVVVWFGLFAPANTPRDIVQKMNVEVNKALASPEVRQKLIGLGASPTGGTIEEFERFVAAEVVRWGKIVADAKIEIQ